MDYELTDDGTLDTVIRVSAEGQTFDLRYSDTSAYRDDSGMLDVDRFWHDVASADAELELGCWMKGD